MIGQVYADVIAGMWGLFQTPISAMGTVKAADVLSASLECKEAHQTLKDIQERAYIGFGHA